MTHVTCNKNTRLITYSLVSGCFFILDQLFKYLARTNDTFTYYLIKPWLGWEYFANPGIAFGLPLPNWLLVLVSPLIIFGLAILLTKKYKNSSHWTSLGLILIIAGAISNLADRIIFEVTIDYIRILTSIMNLADIMIVVGAFLIVMSGKKAKIKK